MSDISSMFEYKGKTTKLIGEPRTQAYQEVYNYLSQLQQNNDLPFNGNYLDDNELADNIYQKKYIQCY